MKHYVYRITNKELNKHYYGVRSAKDPVKDLGNIYFSSSKDIEFIQDQKLYPNKYKYKIISTYKERKLAVAKEIKLHEYFNVGINPNFYNRVKQTTTGFDSTGISPVISDIQKSIISETHKGKILSKETKAKISKNHANVSGSNNPMFGAIGAMKGKVSVINLITGIRGLMFKHDFDIRESHLVSTSSQTNRTLKERTCDHCGYKGKGGNMTRYHFDNCASLLVNNSITLEV